MAEDETITISHETKERLLIWGGVLGACSWSEAIEMLMYRSLLLSFFTVSRAFKQEWFDKPMEEYRYVMNIGGITYQIKLTCPDSIE